MFCDWTASHKLDSLANAQRKTETLGGLVMKKDPPVTPVSSCLTHERDYESNPGKRISPPRFKTFNHNSGGAVGERRGVVR